VWLTLTLPGWVAGVLGRNGKRRTLKADGMSGIRNAGARSWGTRGEKRAGIDRWVARTPL
jgi:hypothetical protein